MEYYFAPLEGITGFTYRNAFDDLFGGVDKYYAPFISPSVNYMLKGKEIKDLLPENNNRNIKLIPQILTNNGSYFIKAARQLIELGYVDEININIGCPSGTVVSKKKGAGFLTEKEEMKKFFDEIFEWRAGLQRPVNISVKTRIGRYSAEEFSDILNIYNRYPINPLIIHPRTREQMYKGVPNMDIFDYAAKHSQNSLCYNGEIRTVEDCKGITSSYRIEGVMIGRGLVANPNLIHEIKGGKSITKDQIKLYHDRLYEDFKDIMKSDRHLLFKMKEFWNYVSWNFEDENKCAKMIHKCQNLYKYSKAVEYIFEKMNLNDRLQ